MEHNNCAVAICEQVKELGDVEMLFTGSRGVGMLSRMTLGSTSHYLARFCTCPVMVVKIPAVDEDSKDEEEDEIFDQ